MGVLAGEVVDLEVLDIALLVHAVQRHRQAVVRLAVVKGLRGHLAGLQLTVAAPLGNGVGGLGDRGAVEADLRLLGDGHQRAGVIADDHGVAFGGVLEVVEHPLFLQQALDEVEVGFAVLGDVGVALLWPGQAKLVAGKRRAQGEHFGDHFLDRVALEDPRVEAVLQHRDAQHFAVGFSLQRRGLVQRISYSSLITYKIRIFKKIIALSKRLHNTNY